MSSYPIWKSLPLCVVSVLLVGCAGVQPAPYTGVASAQYLQPHDSHRTPYVYHREVNWSAYATAVIDPVEVYDGADNQFGEMSPGDRQALASYMERRFTTALAKRFAVTGRPGAGAGAIRIKLILTGAGTSKQVISTLTRVDLAGSVYNNVQAVRGREGAMTGWVMYTVEIYDASTDQLLEAFEAKQYPNPINIKATIGSLSAAKTGIDKGAKALLAQLK